MSAQKTRPMENKPRRSSRRIQGLAPLIDTPFQRTVYLPTELKVAVLAQLDKRDLKTVRLVSKEWNALATTPLFDRVYISCQAIDMEVFRNITTHPDMSAGVRELVYDGSLFRKDIDFKNYCYKVYRQVRWIVPPWGPDTPFKSVDVQINKFVQDYREKKIGFSKLYKTHKMDTFLVEGYRKYRDHSAFEYHTIERGWLFDHLCTGLRSLINLRSVVLGQKMWHYDLDQSKYLGTPDPNSLHGPSSGSPLCRSWNPFHLRPLGWKELPDVDGGHSHVCAHFHMLTRAISTTNQNITSLQVPMDHIGGGLSQQALMKSNLNDWEFWYFMTAYSGLSCLDIEITTNNFDQRDALTVLPELLAHTFGLRRLSLHLFKDVDQPLLPAGVSEYYRYDKIFPAIGIWPKLTELSISGLAIGGWDLMVLILGRARVRRLALFGIDLLDGTWEGVIEGMRRRQQLTELHMDGDFRHCGSPVFRPRSPEDKHTDFTCLIDIEAYVTRGGRHPCLTQEGDPDTAIWWYFDLMPEKWLDDLKLMARECDEYTDDLFRNRQ